VDSDKQPDFEFQTVKKQCVEESAIDSFDWFTGFTIHKRALLPRQCFPKAVLSGRDQESLDVQIVVYNPNEMILQNKGYFKEQELNVLSLNQELEV